MTGVERLAADAGLGPRTVQRLFRRFAGVGVKGMLVRARVRNAVAALDGADPTARPDLAALALELGWYDQSHFTRDFRRITGLAPAQYADRRLAS